jgi:hypothetical protein
MDFDFIAATAGIHHNGLNTVLVSLHIKPLMFYDAIE